MSEKNVSSDNKESSKVNENKFSNSDNQTNNNSQLNKKPILKRRNAVANFELTESYQEFIKEYKINNQLDNNTENGKDK